MKAGVILWIHLLIAGLIHLPCYILLLEKILYCMVTICRNPAYIKHPTHFSKAFFDAGFVPTYTETSSVDVDSAILHPKINITRRCWWWRDCDNHRAASSLITRYKIWHFICKPWMATRAIWLATRDYVHRNNIPIQHKYINLWLYLCIMKKASCNNIRCSNEKFGRKVKHVCLPHAQARIMLTRSSISTYSRKSFSMRREKQLIFSFITLFVMLMFVRSLIY